MFEPKRKSKYVNIEQYF